MKFRIVNIYLNQKTNYKEGILKFQEIDISLGEGHRCRALIKKPEQEWVGSPREVWLPFGLRETGGGDVIDQNLSSCQPASQPASAEAQCLTSCSEGLLGHLPSKISPA